MDLEGTIDHHNQKKELEELHEVKNGLIDTANVLNFDIDTYYKQILTKKSDKLTQDQARVEEFMTRAAERREKTMLPFERASKTSPKKSIKKTAVQYDYDDVSSASSASYSYLREDKKIPATEVEE